MNRTLKDATVRRYYYDTHDQLRGHLGDFLAAYNFARRLKTLRGLTPYVHLQDLDKRAATLQARPTPPNAGTKHLDPVLTLGSQDHSDRVATGTPITDQKPSTPDCR
jgi:hypothetical protein